ncbi:L10-interacting MYB domain-containing protein-like [Humulus lupulus]|uniref:L10-interacting MYB domain-containing protein-like n=1 Tax=Humulus lupulus TaxID=3486 RepID=UPI002B413513|nr:L10-interacting MYB domain-containing protein-like [Humulus lupulus]XP_062119040.1 L10-interacting MYB domain-containing protein-like [Humulus lupulus]
MTSEGEVTQGKSKAIWDPPTHEKWIDLAVEQVRTENRNGSHFRELGWKFFIEKFNLATKINYDRKQMKNHWDNVKKEWQQWDSLLRGETGLGWDIQRQTVDAPDEWWDAKLQVGFCTKLL